MSPREPLHDDDPDTALTLPSIYDGRDVSDVDRDAGVLDRIPVEKRVG